MSCELQQPFHPPSNIQHQSTPNVPDGVSTILAKYYFIWLEGILLYVHTLRAQIIIIQAPSLFFFGATKMTDASLSR